MATHGSNEWHDDGNHSSHLGYMTDHGHSPESTTSNKSERFVPYVSGTVSIDNVCMMHRSERSPPLSPYHNDRSDNIAFAYPSATQSFRPLPLDTVTSHNPESTQSLPLPRLKKGQCFCPFCFEKGITKLFPRKSECKRHMEEHEDRTVSRTMCKAQGCGRTFDDRRKFKKHHKKEHRGMNLSSCRIKSERDGRNYACGFDNCNVTTENWDAHFEHISGCMHSLRKSWTHERVVRNLLGHPRLSAVWKRISEISKERTGISPNDLTWDTNEAERIREQLETNKFGGLPLEQYLTYVFGKGRAGYLARQTASQPSRPSSAPLPRSAAPFHYSDSSSVMGQFFPVTSGGIHGTSCYTTLAPVGNVVAPAYGYRCDGHVVGGANTYAMPTTAAITADQWSFHSAPAVMPQAGNQPFVQFASPPYSEGYLSS